MSIEEIECELRNLRTEAKNKTQCINYHRWCVKYKNSKYSKAAIESAINTREELRIKINILSKRLARRKEKPVKKIEPVVFTKPTGPINELLMRKW